MAGNSEINDASIREDKMTVDEDGGYAGDKKQIRRMLIEKRFAVPLKDRIRLDGKILDNLLNSDEYKKADILLTYVSYNGEADTYGIINNALNSKKRVGCPVCTRKNGEPAIDFYYINSADELINGYRGIREPDPETAEKVNAEDIKRAAVIVPVVGYDKNRNRLGYGGGYYDRFLGSFEYGCSVGIAYSFQECKELPAKEHDIRPDIIITEDRVLINITQ